MVSRHLVRLSSVLAVVLASLPAAEFLQNPADTGSNQNRVWIPDGVPAGEIQGVIVGFEYAFNPYGAAAWRDFCTQRKWALASLPSQDGMGGGSFWWSNVATDGLARLSTLLSQGATALGRPELATSTIPYVFVGLSRGGVLGAINLGWNAGAHKTVGIIAYHGSGVESNMGSYYPYPDQTTAIRAASSAIPVLYKIAQQDTTRQAQIEQVVHTDATRSLRLFYGCPWTTAMTYGAGHSNPGSDTYPLQWLGRVIDQRYDPATKGTLKTAATAAGGTTGIDYTLRDIGLSTCRMTATTAQAAGTSYAITGSMVWVPPGGLAEWTAANLDPCAPSIASAACATSTPIVGLATTGTVTATDPYSDALTYQWSVVSAPSGGNVLFGTATAATTTVTCTGATGAYVIKVTVSNTLAQRSVSRTIALTAIQDAVWTATSAGSWATGANWQGGVAPTGADTTVHFQGATGTAVTQNLANLAVATFDFSARNYTISGQPITLAASSGTAVAQVAATTTQTISSVLQGSNGLTVQGGGVLVVGGVGAWTGTTTVAAGTTVRQGVAQALPATATAVQGTLALQGLAATLGAVSGSGTIDGVSGTPTLTLGADGGTATFDGTITDTAGTLSLVKAGAGTQTISGVHTYAGSTTVQAGVLRMAGSPTAPASGPIRWYDATTLSATNGATVTTWADRSTANAPATSQNSRPPVYVADAGMGTGKPSVRFAISASPGDGNGTSLNFAATAAVRSVVAVFKGSSFLLTAMNSYDFHRINDTDPAAPLWDGGFSSSSIRGGQTFLNGTQIDGTSTAMPTGARNGFNLVTVTTTAGVTVDGFNRDRTFHNGNQEHAEVLLYDRVLTTSERQITEAYLQAKWFGVGPAARLPATTALTVATGAALDLDGTSQTVASLSGAGAITDPATGKAGGTLTVSGSTSTTFSGSLQDDVALVKDGSGTLTLTGVSSTTATTTVSAGTLVIGTTGRFTASNLQVANGAILDLRNTTDALGDLTTLTLTGTAKLLIPSGSTERVATLVINGTPVAPGTWNATTDPVHFGGTGSITVTGATTTPPAITSLSPTAGPAAGGTTVTITGTDLGGATAVTFGGTAATVLTNTPTQITCTTPAKAAGTVAVAVTTGAGTATSAGAFTFQAAANAAPTVATAAASSAGPVTGTTTTLTVLGADDGGEAALTYTWATTGTPPAAVTFSANGTNGAKSTTATFTMAGSYTFQVTIRDAGNLTVTSSVAVNVASTLATVTVSPSTAAVVTGGTQTFTATGADQFGAPLTIAPTWTVSGGGSVLSSGAFTAGTTAGGPFTVTASVGSVAGTAQVTVTPPPNTAPVAAADAYAARSGRTLSVAAPGLLANDTDAEGQALAVAVGSIVGPAQGTLSVQVDGAVTYTPPKSFSGTATFTYRVTDGTLVSDPTTVSVSVAANRLPQVTSTVYTTTTTRGVRAAAATSFSAVLTATDADGDPLTFRVTAAPAHGTLEVNEATGAFTYTITDLSSAADDTFTVVANDGLDDSAPATMTVRGVIAEGGAPGVTVTPAASEAGGGCGGGLGGPAAVGLIGFLAWRRPKKGPSTGGSRR